MEDRDVIQFLWADEFSVARQGDNLFVYGDRKIWEQRDLRDLMLAYEKLVIPPHIQFANCDTDAKLRSFVEVFGPVNGAFAQSTTPEARGIIEQRGLVQNLGELQTDRTLFRAALELMTTLTGQIQRTPAGTQEMDQLVATLQTLPEGTKGWDAQFEREEAELGYRPEWLWTQDNQRQLERYAYSASDAESRRGAGYASSFASVQGDPLTHARNALVLLLNAFPLSLQWYGEAPIEVPPYELLYGIRPLLFAMLRRDLLKKREIRMCKRPRCGHYFVAFRNDKGCCSKKCSAKEASNKRYGEKRKPVADRRRVVRDLIKITAKKKLPASRARLTNDDYLIIRKSVEAAGAPHIYHRLASDVI